MTRLVVLVLALILAAPSTEAQEKRLDGITCADLESLPRTQAQIALFWFQGREQAKANPSEAALVDPDAAHAHMSANCQGAPAKPLVQVFAAAFAGPQSPSPLEPVAEITCREISVPTGPGSFLVHPMGAIPYFMMADGYRGSIATFSALLDMSALETTPAYAVFRDGCADDPETGLLAIYDAWAARR